MATSFNFELNNKPTRNKTYNILLRITQDRKHKRIKTSIELNSPKDFNPKTKQNKWVRTSEPKHQVWNDALVNELEEAKKTYRVLKTKGVATKEKITSTLREAEQAVSFLQYAKDRTQAIYQEGGYRNYKKYNGFCNKLEGYLKTIRRQDLYFAELDTSLLSKFEAYLHTLRNERNPEAKLHPNTIAINLNIFKTIINRAVEVDKILTPEENPFLGYKYTREIASPKDKLNEKEIELIEALELPEHSVIWNTKNCFLFSFYLAGIRAGDLLQLRWNNITADTRLEYRMDKTSKDRSLFLHDKAMDILQLYYTDESKGTDYIFPFLSNEAIYAQAITPEQRATLTPDIIKKMKNDIESKNALLNKYLKKIATKAKIEKNITMHISRHSFAKIAKDNNVDNNHLKNLLGHSSIKVTERYMGSFSHEETDTVMASIFKKKNTAKEKLTSIINNMNSEEIEMFLNQINNKN